MNDSKNFQKISWPCKTFIFYMFALLFIMQYFSFVVIFKEYSKNIQSLLTKSRAITCALKGSVATSYEF